MDSVCELGAVPFNSARVTNIVATCSSGLNEQKSLGRFWSICVCSCPEGWLVRLRPLAVAELDPVFDELNMDVDKLVMLDKLWESGEDGGEEVTGLSEKTPATQSSAERAGGVAGVRVVRMCVGEDVRDELVEELRGEDVMFFSIKIKGPIGYKIG